jgi:hypothetical protein
METVGVIVSEGTRGRLQRIKYLRRQETGIILADQEVIVAAIALYWSTLETRRYRKKIQR